MTEPTLAIDARGLAKQYGAFAAVTSVDLAVPTGTVHAVLGPNGAGKTTTVRMLATLTRPTGGSARILGHDIVRDATAVRSLIGLTGQYASVDNDLSARENLTIFARLLGYNRARARARTDALLEEFSLTASATKPLKNFSGGMRRRLDLAASLIAEPPLIFLDEPTTGLDPRTRVDMWNTVRSLVARGSTVLLTTQYLEEADALADRITVIDHGTVVAEGSPDELKDSIGHSVLRITITDPYDTLRAARIVAATTGTEASAATPGTLTAPLASTSDVPEVLLALRAASIGIRDLAIERPDLNAVFFALTGNPHKEDAA
ncbi:ATP-binding cassette domain-containing protein [Lolliginicoccus levis]|uniref:ATP-binding cassette domain-containing protein n=1 Tax=Lolliginicoccus levis TaxID=2919542 RepID=UPI00241C7B24|nr:ATP-binding cassette domain-containing protein [Lolliginicoccus levis]